MTLWASAVDMASVARFELLRAVRTWRAAAIVVTFIIADAGATRLFVEVLGDLERQLAWDLGVAPTVWPGTMLAQVQQGEQLRRLIGLMVGDPARVEEVLSWPVLAVFQLWVGVGLVPFVGAATAAESISEDMGSRALRYEVLRTGRAELVAGRFLGQIVLVWGAALLGLVATWLTAMATMVVADAGALAWGLFALGGRSALFALPFVGFGVGCSQVSGTRWARVLALLGVAASWAAWGTLRMAEEAPWTWLADVALPLLPQTWLMDLWSGGATLATVTAVYGALALAAVGAGFLLFAGRDL